jgi:hypothetical protein
MAIGGRPDAVHRDVPTQLAVAMSVKFVKGPNTIDDLDFKDLKLHFNDKQISELFAFMVFVSASHQFGVLMDVLPDNR